MTQTHEADARSVHWQHHIDGWQASGLSGANYCRQHQLTYNFLSIGDVNFPARLSS